MSSPNQPTAEEIEDALAPVGRDAIQMLRIQHGMARVRLENVQVFADYAEPITNHLIVRMAVQGRND